MISNYIVINFQLLTVTFYKTTICPFYISVFVQITQTRFTVLICEL